MLKLITSFTPSTVTACSPAALDSPFASRDYRLPSFTELGTNQNHTRVPCKAKPQLTHVHASIFPCIKDLLFKPTASSRTEGPSHAICCPCLYFSSFFCCCHHFCDFSSSFFEGCRVRKRVRKDYKR